MHKTLSQEKTNQKTQNLITVVSANYISLAENNIVKFIQSSMFADELKALKNCQPLLKTSKSQALYRYLEDGIMRVGGRLSFSVIVYARKHPIVISKHRFTSLII